MRRASLTILLVFVLGGCGLQSSHTASPPTPTATSAPATAVARHTPIPTLPAAPTATPLPTATAVISTDYSAFVHRLCQALTAQDVSTLTAALPYYEYNSGLRYGMLGDGEGQTGDPSLFGTWFQGAHVSCSYFTPDIAGHGTLLAGGWVIPGPWSLIELDTFNGVWKINDFTFGKRADLWRAMQTASPVLPYRG